jgi:hypothetical protein
VQRPFTNEQQAHYRPTLGCLVHGNLVSDFAASLITVLDEKGAFLGTMIKHAKGFATFDKNNRHIGDFATADDGAAAIWRARNNQVQP